MLGYSSTCVHTALCACVICRAFDALEDDFNYVLLIVALAALTVGSVLMHYAVKQAGLKRSWK